MKLHLGCGEEYKNGWVNLDMRGNVKSDINHDLEVFPYPFKDNTFNIIYGKHIIEHLADPVRVLKELVRISKRNAIITLSVSHAYAYSDVSDIQHKSHYTENSFTDGQMKQYDLEELKCLKTEFLFRNKYKKYVPFKKYLKIYLNGIYDDLIYTFQVNKIEKEKLK